MFIERVGVDRSFEVRGDGPGRSVFRSGRLYAPHGEVIDPAWCQDSDTHQLGGGNHLGVESGKDREPERVRPM
jgi:hypothetical protein